jgi:hypothetical protein
MVQLSEERALAVELPDEERRTWLLDGLARLIQLRGYEQLVLAPLLIPSNDYFPDAWESSPNGVQTLLRRLLVYAGLEGLRVKLHVYREANAEVFDTHGVGQRGAGAAAWFAGIEDDICTFGVDARELRDVESLIGTLCHEVAHAYRERHGLSVVTRETEELLTDLTAVYLGFGVFLLNSSFSFKTGGYSETGDRLLYEKNVRGYLSPAELAVLLGAQLSVRGASNSQRRAILSELSANQQKLVRDALAIFTPDVEDLRARLGVAPPARWPPPKLLSEFVQPLPHEADADELIELEPSADSVRLPRAQAARIAHSHAMLLAAVGALISVPIAALFAEGWVFLAIIAGPPALGGLLGARLYRYDCSGCAARQSGLTEHCENCRAEFGATIQNQLERLEWEERSKTLAHEDSDDGDALSAREHHHFEAMFSRWATLRGLVDQVNWTFSLDGRGFAEYYFEGSSPLYLEDFELITTASDLGDEEARFQRLCLLLDVRYADYIENVAGAAPLA